MREKYSSHQLKTVILTSCHSGWPHSHYSRDNLIFEKSLTPKLTFYKVKWPLHAKNTDFTILSLSLFNKIFLSKFRTTLFCKIVGAWFEYLFLKRGNASRPEPPLQPNNSAVDEWNRSLIQFRIEWISWVIDMTNCQTKLIYNERKNYFI